MKKKLAALCAAMLMTFTVMAPTTVLAWSDGQEVPGDAGNTSTVEATPGDFAADPAKDSLDGEIEIEGTIGKFDNTKEPSSDPDAPKPPVGSIAWINVTIPKKMFFASTQADNYKIVGSNHRIVNNSAHSVDVWAKSFTYDTNVATNPDHIPGTVLNLNVKGINNTNVADPTLHCTVYAPTVALLGVDAGNNDEVKLITETKIATLNDGISGPGTTNTAGQAASINKGAIFIRLSGSLPNVATTYDTAKNPKYTLVLKFVSGDNLNPETA